ncbi:hypothetical protein [Microcella sp.]|uniref:hypothetical protein n=1 Tax=Microcella sp. TaxID=1913979 RepID=UPI00256D1351|nr:hypothetical protein [Microcella sp.]MBX9470937.1 hypothetical protein [Microcella sp.]
MRADFDTDGEPLREVGGYRVVRTLASSRRGTRLLVHADSTAWVAHVFAHDCPDAVIDHEVSVCDIVRSADAPLSEHVAAAHELCTTDDGRVVLFEPYLPGPRLDTLLRARYGSLPLGEAITILAPLASAIDQGHQLGITGLLAEPAAVRLTASGAPVITRRSTVHLGPALPDRFRDREPGYAADRDAFERFGAAVAAALAGDEQSALLSVLRRRGAALDLALFDLAPPQPVRYNVEPDPSTSRLEQAPSALSTLVPAATAAPAEPEGASESTPLPLQGVRKALSASLISLGLPDGFVSAADDAVAAVARRLSRLDEWIRRLSNRDARPVRPRFIVAGGIGAAALVAAIVVGTQSASSEPEHLDAPQDIAEAPSPASDGARIEPGLAETELHPAPEVWSSLVDELLQRWSECAPGPRDTDEPRDLDSGSVSTALAACASAVVHEGSAAAALIVADDPRHDLVRDWLRAEGDVVVVERMGAAVLLDLIADTTTTASLLVVRSEAGWRIRDVIG